MSRALHYPFSWFLLNQFDQHPASTGGVYERYHRTPCSLHGLFIDQSDIIGIQDFEQACEVVSCESHLLDSCPSLGDESSNRSILCNRLKEF
jgi:hypothetical protein